MKQASTKEKEQKRQAVRGVVLFAALQLLCAVAFWSMTGIPDLPGWCEKLFWGLAVFCIALLIPALMVLKQRFYEIEGGELDAAGKY